MLPAVESVVERPRLGNPNHRRHRKQEHNAAPHERSG
jgi:hypothetical protein